MLPDFENNGYAFEASKKYLDTVCEIESIQKVIAITLPQNSSSIKLLQKLGLNYKETITEGEEYLFLFEISI
jgi:RimJ/RimL family protein N-acetyltransferase